ncbi:pentapeptide repeat-containing protein [Streptomyces sp. NBC_01728]|uniref:pentapeptide repeat-containing protein n=1 Tax=unclassified Streptomyces TaxID=2593676 RepID=UPI00224F33F7|nr:MULTISPECIES: pentapeptide repeat-containing protein [unclassified Streptomyces]MCX4455776.1 pentapeptide repeat-containing protein [Streptomyces sp. NBC_01719]MCX4495136.1 pentapeptide repeat-containing protein [Streptomyces sp. NBC_01728]
MAVALVTSIAAIGALVFTSRSVTQAQEGLGLSQEGQITDRYNAAVENLGDEAMDVRLGGIYSLQRIMQDSRRDHPTVVNVLSTYVRTHSAKIHMPAEGKAFLPGEDELPADIQAAITVLASRNVKYDGKMKVNLQYSHLFLADLEEAELAGADLEWVDLSVARLDGANLRGANLESASLSDADLPGANLRGASLRGASLEDVDLKGADLRDADLRDADLGTVRGVTVAQILSTRLSSQTKLPPEIAKNPKVIEAIPKSTDVFADG